MKTTIVRLRLVFIWRFIFYERRRLLQSQKILAPFILKKNLENGAYTTFSVYVCAKERGWRESKLHLPKANKCSYSRDLYLSKSGHFCLHFLCFHIIVIPFFSNGIKTCIYIQVNTNTCMSYISVYTFCVVNIFVIGLLFLCKGIKTCK